jgi:hypothetical protein
MTDRECDSYSDVRRRKLGVDFIDMTTPVQRLDEDADVWMMQGKGERQTKKCYQEIDDTENDRASDCRV